MEEIALRMEQELFDVVIRCEDGGTSGKETNLMKIGVGIRVTNNRCDRRIRAVYNPAL